MWGSRSTTPRKHRFTSGANERQIVAAINAAAAIVSRLGHGQRYVRYHKETSTTGKWDPGRFRAANEFRDNVGAWVRHMGWR
jgi:hypothetical protein